MAELRGSRVLMLVAAALFSATCFASESDLSDPTKPYMFKPISISKSEEQQPIILNYIKTSAGQAVAYLNGEAVREGDKFRSMKVTKISGSGVLLVSATQRRWVPLLSAPGITRK